VSDPEGLLLVDKPGGMTSHDVVDIVRRRLGTRKVGHAGTLDPMATGLLVLGVGRATRLLRFLRDLPKTYEGTARLGMETTTLDADGEVTHERPVTASEAEVRVAMAALVGDSLQSPPAYSAVKVGGRKLYEAARRGEVLEAAPRPIHVYAFEMIAWSGPDVDFRVTCSGGTYVRGLVATVGATVGSGAHLTRLRRTAIGALEAIEAVEPDLVDAPLPVERAIAHLPRLEVSPEEAIAASHGRILGPSGIVGPYAVFSPTGALIGVYEDEGTKARPQVILAESST
jgi:tRNA pseudouridine55 synthase